MTSSRSDPQRSVGAAEIAYRDGRLARLYQQGCAKLMLPRSAAGREAVLVNTAGGVTGGDRLRFAATLGAGEALTVTTQAAERIYRSAGGDGVVTTKLSLGAGARLDWLPQETILFDGAALTRRLEVEMEEDARLLCLESYVHGRAAMGETVSRLSLRDDWRIRRGGRLVHAEALRMSGPASAGACMGDARASATLLYLGPDAEERIDAARAALPDADAGASAWDGRLVARLLAMDGAALKAALTRFLTAFRGAPLPRVWAI